MFKLSPLLIGILILDTLLISLIIVRIKYTEIDWSTYLQQVKQIFEGGELDYLKVSGDSGPLVYPAGFVYIFELLRLICKDSIRRGQIIFGAIYILTQCIVFQIYQLAEVQSIWPYALLILSRRLHSIYVLRMFNDCLAMIFLYGSAHLLQRGRQRSSVLLYSSSVSIKMNTLLFAPGFALILYQSNSKRDLMKLALIAALVQLILGLPFLLHSPISYISCAFNFGRQFLHKWTVNWRFLPEHIFVNRWRGRLLLLIHITLLYIWAKRRLSNDARRQGNTGSNSIRIIPYDRCFCDISRSKFDWDYLREEFTLSVLFMVFS